MDICYRWSAFDARFQRRVFDGYEIPGALPQAKGDDAPLARQTITMATETDSLGPALCHESVPEPQYHRGD